ncbi:MAG: radical SAM protein [Candidatus Aminicenantes bacterium]
MANASILNSKTEQNNPFKDKSKRIGLIWNENTQWHLKHDVKRVLLYETLELGIVINRTAMLTPNEAIILALFDGKRTIEDVIAIAADIFDETLQKAELSVDSIIGKWSMAFEEKTDNLITPQYDPMKFVIPAWKVDNVTKRLFSPISIQFRVSDSCMRNCVYCNIQTRPHEEMNLIPLERWNQLAQEVKDMDICSILLSGGDPFIHKDIVEIIHCFIKQGIHPFVSTKSFISRYTAKNLSAIALKEIQVSIDAPERSAADFLTQSPGYFDQIIQSIKNVQEENIKVTTNTVVTSYNILLIPQLIRMLNEMGIKRIKLSQYGRTMFNKHDDSYFVSEKGSNWLNNELEKLKEELPGIRVSFSYIPDYSTIIDIEEKKEKFNKRAICTGCVWAFVVSGDGRVIPCDEIPLTDDNVVGDIRTQSLQEVWDSPRALRYSSPPRDYFSGTVCHECEDFDECHQKKGRCFRDALKAYDSLFAPTPLCWKAPKGKRLS